MQASERTAAGYRLYSQEDFNRLSQISLYKEAGLSLNAIAEILDTSDNQLSKILEQRLESLNLEMSRIRQQQQLIVQLLGKDSLLKTSRIMNKEQWIKILKDSGMDENAMHQWYVEFERNLPEVHSDFLESLGMSKEEIEAIKTSVQKELERI